MVPESPTPRYKALTETSNTPVGIKQLLIHQAPPEGNPGGSLEVRGKLLTPTAPLKPPIFHTLAEVVSTPKKYPSAASSPKVFNLLKDNVQDTAAKRMATLPRIPLREIPVLVVCVNQPTGHI